MKRLLIILIFISNICLAIDMQVDYAVYRYSDSLNLLELYYSFPEMGLSIKAVEGKYHGDISFITLIDCEVRKDTVAWSQTIELNGPIASNNSVIIGLKVILVPPGNLDIDFLAINDNQQIYDKKLSVKSPDFRSNALAISDLQIASVIEPKAKSNRPWSESFLKNSLYVVPNPGTDIIGDSLVLNCYFEIYNADQFAPDGVDIIYSVLDGGKKEVFHYPRKKKSYSKAMVEYVSIPVDALPSGVYFLQVDVIAADNKELSVKSALKRFYVSNFNIPPQPLTEFYESLEFETSEFATMSDDAIETHFAQIRPMISEYELGVWDKCSTIGAKQRYLFAFWVNRNPDTTKPYNVALEDFRQRVKHANKNYAYGLNNEGWRTPRGKVLIKYGYPSLIDRHELTGTQPAYEIWKYDQLEGGTEFVFVDLKSTGYFELVHSTVPGEVRFDDWYPRYIEKQDPNENFQYYKDPLKY